MVRLGHTIGKALERGALVLLNGELGTGKTFLARAIARAQGVPGSIPITSPTFALVHEYSTPRGALLHVDLYRIADTPDLDVEVARLGLFEARMAGAMLLVEWGKRACPWLGGNVTLEVTLSMNPAGRVVELTGPMAKELVS